MTFNLLTAAGTTDFIGLILPMLIVVAIMYFMMIRPQRKKEKQLADMRNALEVGDKITTIGGIVGLVVSVKEDTVLIETGSDRTKIRFKRWAIQEVEKFTD